MNDTTLILIIGWVLWITGIATGMYNLCWVSAGLFISSVIIAVRRWRNA